MTKAEQATLEAMETGIYRYLQLMKDGIDGKFEDFGKKLDDHIKESAKQTAPPESTEPTAKEKIKVLGWAVGKVTLWAGGGGGAALLIQEALKCL